MSTPCRITVPSTAASDFDFLAFSFNGKHSHDDFKLYRVSDGDRYNTELAPQMNDITAEVPSADGMFFFGTTHKQKNFNINFAFEKISEEQLRDMKTWLNGKESGDLWFEEEPYKVYTAKVTGTPTLKYLSFDVYENGVKKRIYRGEGSVQFVAYWPYAHTPDYVGSTGTADGRSWASYSSFATKNLWKNASGLVTSGTPGVGENYGDMPSTFILQGPTTAPSRPSDASLTYKVGSLSITVPGIKIISTVEGTTTTTYLHYKALKWNSKTGIVSGIDPTDASEKEKALYYTGTALGTIPVGANAGFVWGLKNADDTYTTTDYKLNYHYWYY